MFDWGVCHGVCVLPSLPPHHGRFGIGLSASGGMVGDSESVNVAVVCNPSDPVTPVGLYALLGYTRENMVLASDSGTRNMGVVQSGNSTVMTWDRDVVPGNPWFPVITPTVVTTYAIGGSNNFHDSVMPTTMSKKVLSNLVQSASTSATPSVSPSVGWVGVSVSASPSPSASGPGGGGVWATSELTSGLSLSWSLLGVGTYGLKATVSGGLW